MYPLPHLLVQFLSPSGYPYSLYEIHSSSLPLPYGYFPAFPSLYGLPFKSPYALYSPNIQLLQSNLYPDSYLQIDTSVNIGSVTSLPILLNSFVETNSLSDYIAWQIKQNLIHRKQYLIALHAL